MNNSVRRQATGGRGEQELAYGVRAQTRTFTAHLSIVYIRRADSVSAVTFIKLNGAGADVDLNALADTADEYLELALS